jgi:hypothetical protein
MLRWQVFAFFTMGCLVTPPAIAAEPAITDLTEIRLDYGMNTVPRFAPDDRTAQILKAERPNGNAHGYNLYVVMLPTNGYFQVVAVDQPNDSPFDVLRDEPHTGEDVVRSVRFAHGKVDGSPATLLITADRQITFGQETGYSAATDVIVTVYRLDSHDGVGRTPDMFLPIREIHTKDHYCHADAALRKQFGLPLPESYEGPATDDGCVN